MCGSTRQNSCGAGKSLGHSRYRVHGTACMGRGSECLPAAHAAALLTCSVIEGSNMATDAVRLTGGRRRLSLVSAPDPVQEAYEADCGELQAASECGWAVASSGPPAHVRNGCSAAEGRELGLSEVQEPSAGGSSAQTEHALFAESRFSDGRRGGTRRSLGGGIQSGAKHRLQLPEGAQTRSACCVAVTDRVCDVVLLYTYCRYPREPGTGSQSDREDSGRQRVSASIANSQPPAGDPCRCYG